MWKIHCYKNYFLCIKKVKLTAHVQSSVLKIQIQANLPNLLTDTSIRRTLLYYNQLTCSKGKQNSYHLYFHNTDTSIMWAPISAPLVSVWKRFHCNSFCQCQFKDGLPPKNNTNPSLMKRAQCGMKALIEGLFQRYVTKALRTRWQRYWFAANWRKISRTTVHAYLATFLRLESIVGLLYKASIQTYTFHPLKICWIRLENDMSPLCELVSGNDWSTHARLRCHAQNYESFLVSCREPQGIYHIPEGNSWNCRVPLPADNDEVCDHEIQSKKSYYRTDC